MEKGTQSPATEYKQSGMFRAFGDVLSDLPIEDRRKLRSLYEEARHCPNDIKDPFHKKCEDLLIACSDVACSTLFARLRTLPCELRDQVYTYLWDAEAIEKVKALWVRYSCNYGRKERRRDIESGSCFTNRECVCDIPSTLPIFARSSYASDIAAENIGIFFRNVKSLIEHTDYIEEHLGEWFFASGVQARDHIRYLEVLISTDLSFSDLRLLNKEPERLDCPPYKEIIAREDAALKENLTSLSTIRFNKGFHLQLVFSNRVQWSSPFLRVLEIIKPICRTLIDEYKFKITILQYTGNASRIRKILRPHGMPPNYLQTDYHLYRSEDLQAYFDNTPKEWLLMMEAKSAKATEGRGIRQEMERLGLIAKRDSDEDGF